MRTLFALLIFLAAALQMEAQRPMVLHNIEEVVEYLIAYDYHYRFTEGHAQKFDDYMILYAAFPWMEIHYLFHREDGLCHYEYRIFETEISYVADYLENNFERYDDELWIDFSNIFNNEILFPFSYYLDTTEDSRPLLIIALSSISEPATSDGYIARSRAHFSVGDLEAAADDYNLALLKDMGAKSPEYEEIIMLAKSNYFEEAKELFQKYTEKPANGFIEKIERGHNHYHEGNHYEAISFYNELIEYAPGKYFLYLMRAMAYEYTNELEKALNDMETYLEFQPEDEIAYFSLGNLAFSIGDYKKSADALKIAVSLDPEYYYYYHFLGAAQIMLQDYDYAISNLARAIELNPEFCYSYFTKGRANELSFRFDRAIEDYSRAIKCNPSDPVFYTNRAAVYMKINNTIKAFNDYGMAIEAGDASSYLHRSISYMGINEPLKAKQDVEKFLEIHPGNADGYHVMGRVYMQMEDYPEALDFFIKSLTINPGLIQSHLFMGDLYYLTGEYEMAIEPYSMGIEHINIGYYQRGLTYHRLGRPEEAIKDFSVEIRMNSCPDSYFLRALNLHKTGDIEGAMADYSSLLANKDNAEPTAFLWGTVYNNKAHSLVKLGRYDEALPLVNRALELEPEESYIWKTRGRLFYHIGEYSQCIDDITRGLEIAEMDISKAPTIDSYPATQYFRGMAYIMLEMNEEGCADLKDGAEKGCVDSEKAFEKHCSP